MTAISSDNSIACKTEKPLHVAIIMDGNGRWAKARHMPRAFGHNEGVKALKNIVECASDFNIKTLSVYAFSTENWRRPVEEVDSLFLLLKTFVNSDLDRLHKNNVRVIIQGTRDKLPKDIIEIINKCETKTKDNTKLNLVICFNYGGRAEIIDAVKAVNRDIIANKINIEDINEDSFNSYFQSNLWEDPDLIIRTAGELRLSNFLMWQSAYSELYFTDKLWPEFTKNELKEAIKDYQGRKRRFGGI